MYFVYLISTWYYMNINVSYFWNVLRLRVGTTYRYMSLDFRCWVQRNI